MKKRISIIISVLAAFLCFCYVLYENVQKAKKITVDESVQLLLEYIYDADYLPLCTRYDSKEDEPLMTVYNAEWVRYPVYEFEIPDDTLPIRRQIVCIGETRDREWLFLGVCLWKYYTEEEERVYRMPKYDSRYAVNRVTKEIVQERYKSDGWWIYNEDYEEIVKKQLIYKDYYE
jgi:hypothetical protein